MNSNIDTYQYEYIEKVKTHWYADGEDITGCTRYIRYFVLREIDLQNPTCKECKETKDKYENLKID